MLEVFVSNGSLDLKVGGKLSAMLHSKPRALLVILDVRPQTVL